LLVIAPKVMETKGNALCDSRCGLDARIIGQGLEHEKSPCISKPLG